MHFPGNVVKKMFPRLVGLGAVVILIGGALIGFQDAVKAGMKLEQPVLAGLICIGIGVLFITIAVMALILQGTWESKGIEIRSKTAQKEVSLNQSSPELAEIDMDVDDEEAEDEGFKKSTRLQRGDMLDIQLKLKSLKSMEILKASCTLLVEQRSKTDRDRLKAVYKKAVEDVNNRGRPVRQTQTVTYRFEQQLPGEQEVSSYTVMWTLRLEIKAKGAVDFLQDIPLKVTA
jgi:hypothetical protein